MTTYSPESQRNFTIQWFKGWSELQKEDFVSVLAPKVTTPSSGEKASINGLVNGMQKLDTSTGRPASLFSCQVSENVWIVEWDITWYTFMWSFTNVTHLFVDTLF
jgi:hypothetical protein